MEISGKIKMLNLNQKVSDNYTKSEVVVTTYEQYPQHILIEFGGQKSDLLDMYKIGDEVEVSINLRGREWTNPQGEIKYFNSIQGWKIKKLSESNEQNDAPVHKAEIVSEDQPEDDLPF